MPQDKTTFYRNDSLMPNLLCWCWCELICQKDNTVTYCFWNFISVICTHNELFCWTVLFLDPLTVSSSPSRQLPFIQASKPQNISYISDYQSWEVADVLIFFFTLLVSGECEWWWYGQPPLVKILHFSDKFSPCLFLSFLSLTNTFFSLSSNLVSDVFLHSFPVFVFNFH